MFLAVPAVQVLLLGQRRPLHKWFAPLSWGQEAEEDPDVEAPRAQFDQAARLPPVVKSMWRLFEPLLLAPLKRLRSGQVELEGLLLL
jgi:hypothetical protein